MKEFISLLMNMMIYPLLIILVIFSIIETISFLKERKIFIIKPKKIGFYIIVFRTILFWAFIFCIVKWLI